MRFLFRGDVTDEEKSSGFSGSPFADLDFKITDMNLNDGGVLFIDLEDENVLLQFDECTGSIFSTTIFRTAAQFPEIKRVKFTEYYDFIIKN